MTKDQAALCALANRIDEADHMILRVVDQDNVGNSELKDDQVSGIDHNLIVDALRKQAAA